MIPRKRKKKAIEEEPFLFSEEDMQGKIENITIVASHQFQPKAEIKERHRMSTFAAA